MTMRGVRAPGSLVVTSAVRGIFRTNAATRAEVPFTDRGSKGLEDKEVGHDPAHGAGAGSCPPRCR